MGKAEQRSDLSRYVDFQINYRTQILMHLNLPTKIVDVMRDMIFELIGTTNRPKLLTLAAEVDRKSRKRRPRPYAEILAEKYDNAIKEQQRKPEEERLSEKTIINNLKPDLAEELGDVRFSASPHQAQLASACREVMIDANRTFYTGKETETTEINDSYL